uniref:Uncharacterized protein n=1 Tax=Anguilla anguilla TaxID=7936 RepID=A0A0E9PKJ9_ANGAN
MSRAEDWVKRLYTTWTLL